MVAVAVEEGMLVEVLVGVPVAIEGAEQPESMTAPHRIAAALSTCDIVIMSKAPP
jgi:hypothetical protein